MERANRFALIVDAADYFALAKAAMLKARHSILLIGWDFDLRIRLTPGDGLEGRNGELGPFLKSIVRRRPELRIFVLKWDMAVLYTLTRQALPLLAFDLIASGRVHLRFDSTHPLTSAHHQKVVVIDDALAFCGGIDMTSTRWDTRRHHPNDGHRVRPNGTPYGPWHDTTTAVDGAAARALGELARQRWLFATGEHLPAPESSEDPWPEELVPQLRNVDVGIARTMPAYEGRPQILEIEKLYVEAIRSARRFIYVESQYFASARICDALAHRLRERGGPEVIVVNPQTAEGWLEEEIMGAARAFVLKRIAAADEHGRFRIYYPVNEAGEPIYVHSKVLVVDDRLLRVGSSNINNRSMGFDSECDLAFEAAEEDDSARAVITNLRNDLLAEHLSMSARTVAKAIEEHGSLLRAIEALRRGTGRSLRRLPVQPINAAEEVIVESRVADPERPRDPETRLKHLAKRIALRIPPSLISFSLGLTVGVAAARAYAVQAPR